MELVAITHVLLPHRWLLLAGALIAVLAGLVASGVLMGSAQVDSATAVSRVQIDAPHPLVAEKHVKGAETITPRARVFAFLMSDNRITAGIARRAGLEPGDLAVANAGSDSPLEVTPLADEASSASIPKGDHVVTVAADPQVPVILLSAAAPDAASAERLANAATDELVALVERIAPGEDGHRYLLAKPLGEPTVEVTEGGTRWYVGVAVGLIVFVLWCSAIVLVTGAIRAWRRSGIPGAGAAGSPQQS